MQPDQDETAGRGSFFAFLVVLAIGLAVAFRMTAPFLLALLTGEILATLAKPLMRRLKARGVSPHVAAGLLTLLLIFLLVGPFLVFLALAVRQAISISKWMAAGFSLDATFDQLAVWGPFKLLDLEPRALQADVVGLMHSSGKGMTEHFAHLARGLPEGVLHLFIACVACYVLLLDGSRFFRWMAGKIPIDADIRRQLLQAFRATAVSVVWASLAAASLQATSAFIMFLVLGVPAAALALVATFLFAWVPLVGSTPIWLGGAAYLLFNGSMTKLMILGIAAFCTMAVDHVIRPLVLRGRGEMHPLISLVAIFGGLHFFGLTGVLFGPIVAAVVMTLLKVWPVVGRRAGLMFDEPEIT